MPDQELHVHLRHEDGSYWATVEEFPGVFATGDTPDELRESLEEGIALMLADDERGTPTVRLSTFRAEPLEATASMALSRA